MILLDFSQVIFGQIHSELARNNEVINEDLVRHLAINQIRSYNKKYRARYGEMIICIDSITGYWRKKAFKYYKWKRAKDRGESDIDWDSLFPIMNRIRDEVMTELPFVSICVDKCEADDIIGVLCKRMKDEKTIIISSDGDFRQLHIFDIAQYSPTLKKPIVEKNPERYLFEHVVRGDGGDGIPGILAPSNFFKLKDEGKVKKQPSVYKKWLQKKWDEYRDIGDQTFRNESEKLYKRWKENLGLIDLVNKIPEEIEEAIWSKFVELKEANPERDIDLYKYFRKNRMVRLIEDISDFDVRTTETMHELSDPEPTLQW